MAKIAKFNVNDIVHCKSTNEYFKIRSFDGDCYDAAYCDKDGNLTCGSIDIWQEYESDFEKITK